MSPEELPSGRRAGLLRIGFHLPSGIERLRRLQVDPRRSARSEGVRVAQIIELTEFVAEHGAARLFHALH